MLLEVEDSNTEQQVRELAYKKWQVAGEPEGDGVQFWLDAEREIRECYQSYCGCSILDYSTEEDVTIEVLPFREQQYDKPKEPFFTRLFRKKS
jgi:hypothetical protein